MSTDLSHDGDGDTLMHLIATVVIIILLIVMICVLNLVKKHDGAP